MSGGDELKKIGLGQTLSRNVSRNLAKVSVGLLAGIGLAAAGGAQTPDVATPTPLIDQDETLKVSDHVYVILDDDVGFLLRI